MCNRYNLNAGVDDVASRFDIDGDNILDYPGPNFNVAPTQRVAAIYINDGKRILDKMRWGFIPSWSKGKPKTLNTNAISEEIAGKPTYRTAWKWGRRCLIPATGFFEWYSDESDGKKQPVNFRVKESAIFALGGIFDYWNDPETNQQVTSCSILTTSPNSLCSKVHNRMPVIIHRDEEADWLDSTTTPDQAITMCRSYEAESMTAHLVDRRMGNSRWNTDEAIKEIAPFTL